MLTQIVGSNLRRLPVRQFVRALATPPAASDKPATTTAAPPVSDQKPLSLHQTHRPNDFEKKVRVAA